MRRALLLVLVTACGKSEPTPPAAPAAPAAPTASAEVPQPLNGFPLPVIAGAGVEPAGETRSMVLVSPTAIVVEGKQVVAVRDGGVDPAELEGGGSGRRIPKLTELAAALEREEEHRRAAAGDSGSPGMWVGLHPATPARLMYQVLYSLLGARVDRIALLAAGPGGLVTLPLTLPAGPPEPGLPPARTPPLDLMVRVAPDRLQLLSLSGLEGSMQQPALSLARGPAGFELDRLRAALAAIVARRFPDGHRSGRDRQIILEIDGQLDVQQAMDVLAAVRAGDGGELFPAVVLASGFP